MDQLFRLRLRNGLSQRALAAASGVSRNTIQRVEAGARTLNAEKALDIAPVFGMTEAAQLREQSGASGRVIRALAIITEGKELKRGHLGRLPLRYRNLLMASYEASRAFRSACDELTAFVSSTEAHRPQIGELERIYARFTAARDAEVRTSTDLMKAISRLPKGAEQGNRIKSWIIAAT